LQYVAVCCSALQCVAVCCSVLRKSTTARVAGIACTAVAGVAGERCDATALQRGAKYCSMLRCRVCCSVLQCVAVCCSVLLVCC